MAALTPPVLAVPAARAYGLTPGDIGLFTAILFVTGMTSAAAGGGLVLRLGAIRISQICLLCAGAGLALGATAFLPFAILGALFVGMGYGPMTPASSHLLAPVTQPRWRPFVFSLKQTSVPLGGVLAGVLVPVFVDIGSWQGAALTVAGLTVVGAVALQPLRARYDADRNPSAGLRFSVIGPVRRVLATPKLRDLAVVSLLFSSFQICFSAYFVAYLSDGLGYTLAKAGLALAIAQGAGVVARIAWGGIASRTIGARPMMVILAVVCSAAGIATLFMTRDTAFPIIIGLGIVFGASAVGWNGLFLAEVVNVTSVEGSAAATGGALFFTFGGMMVGPAVFSAIIWLSGSYAVAFTVAGAWVLPAVFLLMRRSARD